MTFAAKKTKVHPICVIYVISGFMEDVLFTHKESKVGVTSTSSTAPILLLNSINPTPGFVKSVLKNWTHTLGFIIAPDAIMLPTLIVV